MNEEKEEYISRDCKSADARFIPRIARDRPTDVYLRFTPIPNQILVLFRDIHP